MKGEREPQEDANSCYFSNAKISRSQKIIFIVLGQKLLLDLFYHMRKKNKGKKPLKEKKILSTLMQALINKAACNNQ